MKKAITATVAAAAAGLASAQSSVTLFGELDVGVSRQSATATDPLTGARLKSSQTALNNSGIRASRLGFRGTEDLGGGLAASFWLEAPLSNDDGASGLSFSRRATVSLSGRFGELRLGRDDTSTYRNDATFDPFGTQGSGGSVIATVSGNRTLANSNAMRSSNAVGYFLPGHLGGFYGQVQYAFPENVSSSDSLLGNTGSDNSGRYLGGRFGYARGPLDVAFSYGRSNVEDNGTLTRQVRTANLGGTYDFGAVKLFGELSQVSNRRSDGVARTRDNYNGWLLGASAPVGAGLLRAAYSTVRYSEGGNDIVGQAPKAQKLSLGYEHYLSKRTSLYATVARVVNRNDASYSGSLRADSTTGYGVATYATGTLPKSATGYDFGIRHAF